MKEIILDTAVSIKNVHFIGIGGVHMSGIAKILNHAGFRVTGSDMSRSHMTNALTALGITVHIGHEAGNIADDTDCVVYTAAVKPDNPEFIEARKREAAEKLILLSRAVMLGLIMKNYACPICVAGTHGKTSTNSMLAEVFIRAGKDSTVLIGGEMSSIGGNLQIGGGEHFIVEACEYTNSFLEFFPMVGIILNVEADHLDFFKDIDEINESFGKFARLIPEDGLLVINRDTQGFERVVRDVKSKIVTFGKDLNADFYAEDIVYDTNGYPSFEVCSGGKPLFRCSLQVPGEHMIQNALSVAATALNYSISPEDIREGLFNYRGAKRRFEALGEFAGAMLINDYAHHPTEIKATLASAKNIPHGKIFAVFQPHTKTRTKSLLNELAGSFSDADEVIILDIYLPAGREENGVKVSSKDLTELISGSAKYAESFGAAKKLLEAAAGAGDIIIVMGAGDVDRFAADLAIS